VAVYSGLIDVFAQEEELAVVLAHEVAHAVARHGAEKLAFTKIVLFSEFLANLVINNASFVTRWLVQLAANLPYSRKLESEADYIGLQLMAEACYDPAVSHRVFQRLGVCL